MTFCEPRVVNGTSYENHVGGPITWDIQARLSATALVEVRSQHAKGSGWQSGPDRYVAVQIVPAGQDPLLSLNSRVAKCRGIEIRQFGEGYSNRTGPRSSLGMAIADAEEFAAAHNALVARDFSSKTARAYLRHNGEGPAERS